VRLSVVVVAAWAMFVGILVIAGRTEPTTGGPDLLEDRAKRLERANRPRVASPAQPAEELETSRRAAEPHELDTRDPPE